MNASERASLRGRFEELPGDYVLTLADVSMVPAVLGRKSNWSYSMTDGALVAINAYNMHVRTIEDLRRVSEMHPRTEDDDIDPGMNNIVEAAIDHLYKILNPIFDEVTLLQLRVRILNQMLIERDPESAIEMQRRFIVALERDYAVMREGITNLNRDEYAKRHSAWFAAADERYRELVGADHYEVLDREWRDYVQRNTPVGDGSASSVQEE